MRFDEWLRFLKNGTMGMSRYLERLGVVGLLLMFAANLIDVIGAKVFTWPLPGAVEVIAFSQAVAVAPAIALGLILGRHIQVDFFIALLPKRPQKLLNGIISLIALGLFAILLWQSILYGRSLQLSGELGSTSRIPFFPFAYLIGICCIPVCLFFLIEFLDSFSKEGRS